MRYRKPASAARALRSGFKYRINDCQIEGVIVGGKAVQPSVEVPVEPDRLGVVADIGPSLLRA
jgi:hypothetical protein